VLIASQPRRHTIDRYPAAGHATDINRWLSLSQKSASGRTVTLTSDLWP